MAKQCLTWKPVANKNVRGADYQSSLPELIAQMYRGNLLTEILKMPRKKPISFTKAVQLISNKANKAFDDRNSKLYLQCYSRFTEFISDDGYHIELSGDEFVFHLSTDRGA